MDSVLTAFLIATVTAFSYLELVTKYPQAAGAALYVHKAFGVQFVTFLVAFVVMCSGINLGLDRFAILRRQLQYRVQPRLGQGRNRRGGTAIHGDAGRGEPARGWEGVKLNVLLTIIEISGLMLVILVGLWASPGAAPTSTSPAWWRSTPRRTRTPSWPSRPPRRWLSSRWSASRTR